MEHKSYRIKASFFVSQEEVQQKIQALIEEHYPYIRANYYTYDTYEQIQEKMLLLTEEDVIVFDTYQAYEWNRQQSKQKTHWMYVPVTGSTITTALVRIREQGYFMEDLSIDIVDRLIVEEAIRDLGYKGKPFIVESGKEEKEKEEPVYRHHYQYWKEGKIKCVLTTDPKVGEKLKAKQLPYVYAIPTSTDIRTLLQDIMRCQIDTADTRFQVALLSIAVEYPSEYAIMKETETQHWEIRQQIERQIYRYADRLLGCVWQWSDRMYFISTTREQIERETDTYQHLTLLEDISRDSLYTISIGIGIAPYAGQAKKQAVTALLWAKRQQKNSAYVRLESGDYLGPIYGVTKHKSTKELDTRFQKMAEHTQLSVNTIYNIYCFSSAQPNRYFTSWELAEELEISKRSADRMLRKLEDCGYIRVVSKRSTGKSGRPTRVMRLVTTK